MKRLLVIGKRGGILQWYEHVLAAAAKIPGVETLGFAVNQKTLGDRLVNRWHLLIGQDPHTEMTARLADTLRRFRPDICLIVDRFYLSPAFNDLLSVVRIPVHQWVGDRFDERLVDNSAVQRFWFTDSGLASLAQTIGIREAQWLPLAVNTDMYVTRLPWHARAPELLFVGAWSENRQQIIEQLTLPMRLVGKGWHRLASPWHQVHPYNITQAQLVELYGRHRYILNVINSDNIMSGLNMRCFEATAAGACLVTDDVADLARCFHAGEEVLAWKTPEDIVHLPDAPDAMTLHAQLAQRGRERTLAEHDYRHRLQQILNDS